MEREVRGTVGELSRARIRTALAMLWEVLEVSQGCSATHSGSLAEAFVSANEKGWGQGKGQAQGKELLSCCISQGHGIRPV